MKFITKTGFTLIELLVVITIIGILATGATTVYTSQIQKARDTVRTTDILALKSGIEQFYQDEFVYPDGSDFGDDWVKRYVPLLPTDPKSAQNCNNTAGATTCDYVYAVWDDWNGISYGSYEISTAFENAANVDNKASQASDGGTDDSRLEFWLDLDSNDTSLAADVTTTTAAGADTTRLIIKWDTVVTAPTVTP